VEVCGLGRWSVMASLRTARPSSCVTGVASLLWRLCLPTERCSRGLSFESFESLGESFARVFSSLASLMRVREGGMEPWAMVRRFMVAEHADLPVADRVCGG